MTTTKTSVLAGLLSLYLLGKLMHGEHKPAFPWLRNDRDDRNDLNIVANAAYCDVFVTDDMLLLGRLQFLAGRGCVFFSPMTTAAFLGRTSAHADPVMHDTSTGVIRSASPASPLVAALRPAEREQLVQALATHHEDPNRGDVECSAVGANAASTGPRTLLGRRCHDGSEISGHPERGS